MTDVLTDVLTDLLPDRHDLARDVMLALLRAGTFTAPGVAKVAYEIADAYLAAAQAEPAAEP